MIEFHSGVTDKLHHALRLVRKAVAKGARVAVSGDVEDLRRLNAELWTADPRDFIAHVLVADQPLPARFDRTPVWLVSQPSQAPRCDALIHLGHEAAEGIEGFERVIDVVSTDDVDRRAGRARWRNYESRGHPIEHRALDASGRASQAADGTSP